MCKEMEEIHADGIREGFEEGKEIGIEVGKKEGIEAGRKEIAQTMASEGMSIEMIAKMTKSSIETIQKWLAEA